MSHFQGMNFTLYFVLGYKNFAKVALSPRTTKFMLQKMNSMIQKNLLLLFNVCTFVP